MSLNNKDKSQISIPLEINYNQNIFSLTIKSYKEKHIERKSEVYYLIQITNTLSNKKWEIEKSINDFEDLYKKLFKLYPKLPSIPKKSLYKITSLHTLDKRKYGLQNFLQHCINRKDILLNKDFINFLEISKNSPDLVGNSIIKIEESEKFNLSVSKFKYIKNKNILIISLYNNEFPSRDELSLDNLLMIRDNGGDPKKPLGYIIIYKYEYINEKENKKDNHINNINNINNSGKFNLIKLWEKSLLIQTNIILFDELKELLCVGNDDGSIYVFKSKNEGDFKEMETLAELTFHSDKISGLYLNCNEMNLYSCSYDNTFFVTNLADNSFSKSLIYNNSSAFTGLDFVQKYDIFITSDEDGIISIYKYEKNHYIYFFNVQTTLLDKINVMNIYENYVILGANNGKICVMDLSLIKNKSIREIITFDIGLFKIICIWYNSKNDEIIIGDEIGRIIIWNNKIGNYIYSFEAHSQFKVNHLWIDNNNVLWSCGDDKIIKKWKIPEKWFDKDLYLYLNNINYNEKQKENKIFDNGDNDSISSDEDNLNNWSNKAYNE